MKKYIGREMVLLALSSAPILVSFYILSLDAEWARRFIKVQLIGTSLASWLTLGLAPTLSALSLASPVRPPRWLLLVGSFSCPAFAIIMSLTAHGDLADAGLIASLTTISILYRLPAMRLMGRAILLAQFLVVAPEPGRTIATSIVAATLAHLTYLGVFRHAETERMPPATVGHAYLVSVVKDFFYRGHYILLSSIGVAGPNYAAILRFLDIFSRPTDYIFQRLVDEGQIAARLRYVSILVPACYLFSGLTVWIMPGFSWASLSTILIVSMISGLITITKYLAYEQNAKLQFASMTAMYSMAIIAGLPFAFLRSNEEVPLFYFTASLFALMFALLTFRSKVARGNS